MGKFKKHFFSNSKKNLKTLTSVFDIFDIWYDIKYVNFYLNKSDFLWRILTHFYGGSQWFNDWTKWPLFSDTGLCLSY